MKRPDLFWSVFGTSIAAGTLIAVLSSTDCNPSSSQVQTTIADGAKVGACILGEALGGVTDPAQIIAQCAGATEQLIVDVIDDFESKLDAGTPAPSLEAAKKAAKAALFKNKTQP